MSVIIFFAVLFVLVLVHEWGHFIVAKKTGMRVDEFAIGFPPKLFSIKRGETEYTINLLPIGGFVRIFGENLDTAKDTLDQPRSFAARPRWAQALVLVAGVTMNIILAWFLFAATFMIGVPTAVEEAAATNGAELYIAGVLPGSALEGEVSGGSKVTAVSSAEDTLTTLTPSAFSEYIQAHAEQAVTLEITSGKKTKTVTVTPEYGVIADDASKAAIGVSLALVETVQQPFFSALSAASVATVDGLRDISVGLYSLLRDTVHGTADFSQVAGPVGIVGMVGDAASLGITTLLTFMALISLNLAVINMLPMPALDGGRLLFVAFEAVTRRAINPVWAGRLNLVGFVLLMLLMVIVTWNDIARLL